MSNVEKNLKSFTFEELKDIIRNHNKVNAINGFSKYKTKGALISFLVKEHKDKFKSLKDRKTYDSYVSNIITEEHFKKFKEDLKKFDELNKYIVSSLIPKKRNLPSTRNYILNEVILKGKKEDSVKKEYRKIYREELKKLKARNKKDMEKLKKQMK